MKLIISTYIEVISLKHSKLFDMLLIRDASITLEHVLDNSKADSGGQRDVNFLRYLIDNEILVRKELALKRATIGNSEEYYLEKYKKINYESDRHFLCRSIIQEELENLGINTINDISVGNMDILRSNSNYDIIAEDFSVLIDVGLTPARNFFRGLTDLKVKDYLITSYFDDYMDDIIFSCFTRSNDDTFIDALKDYQEGFKLYIPNLSDNPNAVLSNKSPHLPE
jgi:hypothetical protein